MAYAVHGQQPQRIQHAFAQIGNGNDVLEALVHASCSVWPPAAAIFAAAVPLNLCARTVSALPTSPRARILIRRSPPATRPCSRSSSGVTTVPASNFRSSVSRLTISYSTRNGLWKPRLGTRRCSGIWPPSKPRLNLNPDRDFAPLCPRPAVLPLPDPWPRPTRFRACFIPFGGRRLLRLMLIAHFDEMPHLVDHAARGRRVLQLHGVPDAAQPESAHDRCLLAVEPDRALQQRDFHRAAFAVRSRVRHSHHHVAQAFRLR